MKISTKGEYALRMLIDLAEHQEDGFVPLKDIAKRQSISKKYLEQIVALLNNANFLITSRGSQGGYKLLRSLDEYTIGDVLRCAEGNLLNIDCINNSDFCNKSKDCGLNKVINEYLDSITLKDIIDKKHELFINDYVI